MSDSSDAMDFRLAVFVTLLCLTCTLVTYYRQKRRRQRTAFSELYGCKPPTRLPNDLPLGIDNLIRIFRAEDRLMELFLDKFRAVGNNLDYEFLTTRSFGTNDPINIESILNSNCHNWSLGLRQNTMYPLLGDGIFTQDDPKARVSRNLLRPHFALRYFKDHKVFNKAIENLFEALPSEGIVDLQPFIFKFTLDVITKYLFGESVDSLRNPTDSSFASSFNRAQRVIAKRTRLMDLYWIIDGRKFRKACTTVHDFADRIIEKTLERQKHGQEDTKNDFLTSLSRDFPERVQLRNQIVNILVAGRDTTACLISWTFFLLVRHPSALRKLQMEVHYTFSTISPVTRDDLKQMTYLQNTLREVLRLYPPVPVNSRIATCNTVLPVGGGKDHCSPIYIPEGGVVSWSVYSLHRRPDFWGMDSEIFRPERWEEKPAHLEPLGANWRYLPFNGGPRRCLGEEFALDEAAFVVARFLKEFPKLKLPKGEEVCCVGKEKQSVTLVLASTDGCRVDLG